MRTSNGKLRSGDNLDVLKDQDSGSINLIYLDPPYNSGRDYNVVVEDSLAHEAAYTDTWTWDERSITTYSHLKLERIGSAGAIATWLQAMERTLLDVDQSLFAYLVMMSVRLLECHRVLSPFGSIYLHCDPNASHYLKMMLDLIFGKKYFRSEVIWKRTSAHNNARRHGPCHDVILFYTKSDKYVWNITYHARDGKEKYDGEDEDGRRWIRGDLTGAGATDGESGQPWRGVDVAAKDRHWAIPNRLRDEYQQLTGKLLIGSTQEQLESLLSSGLVVFPKKEGGVPRYKNYISERKGIPLQDIWTDLQPVTATSEESVEFDGQKPMALLERVILSSSNPGDVVLDPFLGSGTTALAAQSTGRSWVGIEMTPKSLLIAKRRLSEMFGPECFDEENDWPCDLEAAKHLAAVDKNKFEVWAVRQLRGVHSGKRGGGDGGKDGKFVMKGFSDNKTRLGLISVKSGALPISEVRAAQTILQNEKAEVLLFVSFKDELTAGKRREALGQGVFSSGHEDNPHVYPRVQFIAVEDMFAVADPATLARLPGFVTMPDLSKTKAGHDRELREIVNNLEDLLPQED